MFVVEVLGGLALLAGGGDLLVRGAVALARRLGVSALVIGLTVVAFGTSAPELVVGLTAGLEGAPAIVVGTVVGSNIANLLLILAVAALIRPVACNPRSVYRDGGAVLGASLLFVWLASLGVFRAGHGVLLLFLLGAFIALSYWTERGAAAAVGIQRVEEIRTVPRPIWLGLLSVAAGLAGVAVGAELLVQGAVGIARAAGISETVIGLTLVAVGSSLPELATVVVAAFRRHPDVAIGNVLGSNVFNTFGIMGAVGLAVPVPVPDEIVRFDIWLMLGVTVVLIPVMATGWRISRREAALLLAAYAAYVTARFLGFPAVTAGSGWPAVAAS
ncbi:MAG: calcium/sodium antiporter [Kiloniellales bacterium]